ncbi:TRAM domain-containing protein [Halorubrum gandharaense]
MVELTDSLKCLFTGEVEESESGEYVVRIPRTEVEHDTVRNGETYRVVLLDREASSGASGDGRSADGGATSGPAAGGAAGGSDTSTRRSSDGRSAGGQSEHDPASNGPPVSEGDVRDVTIETLGDQGDGIAKIERGYVVIVPDAELGDEVTVEITSVRENVSFASVVGE